MRKNMCKRLMLVVTLITMMLGSNITAFAETTKNEVLTTVNDEEYAQYIKGNVSGEMNYTNAQSVEDNPMVSIKKQMQGQPEIPAKYIKEENKADSIIFHTEDVEVMTNPKSDITPYVVNPESLKNGMITTDTQMVIVFRIFRLVVSQKHTI